MLITCADCGKEISDQAPSCIGCGRPSQPPTVAYQPPSATPYPQPAVVYQPAPSSPQPTMVGAYAQGMAGKGLGCIGSLTLGVGVISMIMNSQFGIFWCVVGVVLLVAGGYARFSSAHSVRNVR